MRQAGELGPGSGAADLFLRHRRRGHHAITKQPFLYWIKPDEWRYIPPRAFQPAEVGTLRRKLATLSS
jgi:hypothetical protein